ncbi:MAG TPA: hypothetical protein VL899_04720 [Alphaproteobacteria bacterium]|jgi:hypothetical protein|nr:hypothetical protein [Alphaproteobacteria bacterium]
MGIHPNGIQHKARGDRGGGENSHDGSLGKHAGHARDATDDHANAREKSQPAGNLPTQAQQGAVGIVTPERRIATMTIEGISGAAIQSHLLRLLRQGQIVERA